MQVNDDICQFCKLGIDDNLSSTDSLDCAFTPVASVATLGMPLMTGTCQCIIKKGRLHARTTLTLHLATTTPALRTSILRDSNLGFPLDDRSNDRYSNTSRVRQRWISCSRKRENKRQPPQMFCIAVAYVKVLCFLQRLFEQRTPLAFVESNHQD